MVGRPTDYTPELAEDILTRIMEGQGVAEIGRDETMPSERTIFRWLASNDDFCQRYTCAKEISAEYMAEDMLDIADNAVNDWMKRNGKEDEDYWVANGEHIQRSRLRIETRKWLMSKLKPKKYGDKLNLDGNLTTGLDEETREWLGKR